MRISKHFSMVTLFCAACRFSLVAALPSDAALAKIGDKIWHNECAGKIDGLTHWNQGEDFGSFGIGHFIWYPEGKQDRFRETFPDLLAFLQQHDILLPFWLVKATGCPWSSREEFYQEFQSPRMVSLRQLLFATRDLQALFIVSRLETALPEMTKNLAGKDKKRVSDAFADLSRDPRGLYALIDYTNFKGLGTSPQEAYNGYGWGLLQVLLTMPSRSPHRVEDFIAAAKGVLQKRVKNAPPERNEGRWLKGWLNRIERYSAT